MKHTLYSGIAVALVAVALVVPVRGQVGAGILDVNTASEAELTALPHMTAAIVASVVEARPFASVVELNTLLTSKGLSAEAAAELYAKAFIHVNLNTGTRDEILLIPNAGEKMAHEFDEYRPWVNFTQFDREIGKYVDDAEVNRLKMYVFVPLDLNTASDAEFKTIPGVGDSMAHEFDEYRPWTSEAQFKREIGKYVDEKEVARLWRYVVIK
jgi:DNA uptake protein ComE-like DNA-binding protein